MADSSQGLTRRQFLGGVAVALAGSAAGEAAATGATRLLPPERRDLVPGETVRVPWPSSLSVARVRVVHRLDGRVTGTVPVGEPGGWPLACLSILAVPPDGRLPAGRHEFDLELDGRRLPLGGFEVAPFRFGC